MNMSLKVMAFAAGLLALAMVSGVHVALAQQNSRATDIALVDVAYIMQHAAAAKNFRAQVEEMRADNQKAFEGKIEAITKVYEEIADSRATLSSGTLSDVAYKQQVLELQQLTKEHQNEALARQDRVAGALLEGLRKIADTIEEVVNQISQEQKLLVVLPRSAIVGTAAVPDITQEVLTRLDQRMPTIAVELAKPIKAATD